ncbi:hypothetical protein BPNPMPFG_002533 [Mesorhizobium sp. AR07]|uniref:hypothetical protein n=1 Tax=Mesorhizobium sp. AR07 TaxID=2865838 RepID=UPI00215FEE84|nr:hypothetical protein [Mesorhizobium sp. AR07]UVK46823.1 hypothetical protein BPNPMPFG_002533 [Mesorhizobium sp. AR07]
MNLGYTIHTIHRAKEALPVGAVIDFSDTDYEDLLKVGAIREPSDTEVELYNMTHRPIEPAKLDVANVKPVAKLSGKAAKAPAPVEPAAPAAPETPAPVDSDVVDAPLV